MSGLNVTLHKTTSNTRPEVTGHIIFTAVDVAAVNEGCDGVDLLSARLTTSWSGASKVNAGHAGVLPHGEGWVSFRNVDVEALWTMRVETTPLLREAGAADVVVQELTELHHHAAHPLIRVVTLRKGSSHHTNIGKIITWT